MPMMSLQDFDSPTPADLNSAVMTGQDISKGEMDIFFRDESDFIPAGKTIDNLTEEEKEKMKAQFRWDAMRPSTYQGITGLGNMI